MHKNIVTKEKKEHKKYTTRSLLDFYFDDKNTRKKDIDKSSIQDKEEIDNKVNKIIKYSIKSDEHKKTLEYIDREFKEIVKTPYKSGFVKKLKFLSIIKEMKINNIKKTKREIFYTAVNIFENQRVSDYYINSFIKKYNISLGTINISASLKGLFYGKVIFKNKDNIKILHEGLIPDVNNYNIFTEYKNIIVLEKDTLLSFIVENFKNNQIKEYLLVTGKGYPCNNTISFLQKLQHGHNIYGIFDLDPFGINIYRTYKSKINIKRIGIRSKDIFNYKINIKELISIKEIDKKILENILKVETEDAIIEDLKFIKGMDKKMEVEIFNIDFNFLLKFIKDKIK